MLRAKQYNYLLVLGLTHLVVVSIPGKGNGVRTAADIKKNTAFHGEWPIIKFRYVKYYFFQEHDLFMVIIPALVWTDRVILNML